jgi:hypothetical protein
MRKTKKLAAVMAVALGVGITPYANAVIELKNNGTGDALLFPVFNGYIENYFTISNNHNAWIQGHIRFRGAAWSGELRDFDVILSPGDVFVFRLADLNGDGRWEIDQNLDLANFQYTGQVYTCPDVAGNCLAPNPRLIPPVGGRATQEVIDYHLSVGYIEFFGEAVLDGMTHGIMNQLVNQTGPRNNDCGNIFNHQTKFYTGRGTNAWMWSDSDRANFTTNTSGPCDRGLSDVPNVLSGTAFITIPGTAVGVAYNAEAFTNFRTATYMDSDADIFSESAGTWTKQSVGTASTVFHQEGQHRIDNYRRNSALRYGPAVPGNGRANPHPNERSVTTINLNAEDRAVILHNETAGTGAGTSPNGDYVYEFVSQCIVAANAAEDRRDECRISFNNTWGPTFFDGDDYNLDSNFTTAGITDYNAYNVANTRLRPMYSSVTPFAARGIGGSVMTDLDDFDRRFTNIAKADERPVNSLAEVEEAIRIGGQNFFAYYFDGQRFDMSSQDISKSPLRSYYFGYFPTKFFWFEDPTALFATTLTGGAAAYVDRAVNNMLNVGKPLNVEVWDIFENSGGFTTAGCISPDPCGVRVGLVLGYELNFFDIKFLKSQFTAGTVRDYKTGRVALSTNVSGANNPQADPVALFTWPGLFYTFEISDELDLAHWRSMQRGQ